MSVKVKYSSWKGYLREIMFRTLPTKTYVSLCYRMISKRKMNIDNPRRLSEKWWYCMYYNKKHNKELIQIIADKADVQDYMREKGLGQYLKKCYGIFDDPDQIDFSVLPDKFAMKLTQANGYNIICMDKSKLDIEETKRTLREMLKVLDKKTWMFHDLAWISEKKARIVVEEFLEKEDGSNYLELNIYCFNGKPTMTLIVNDYLQEDGDIDHNFTRNFYDIDWNPIPVKVSGNEIGYTIDKPEEYEDAIKLAEELSKDFLLLRVDLYVGDGKIILSELTPAPAGLVYFEPDEYDFKFGDMLELPDVKVF